MKEFISEIKKINAHALIYKFSELSIQMFHKQQHVKDIEAVVSQFGWRKKVNVQLLSWDIPDIEFLAVKHSGDHRGRNYHGSVVELVNLYRKYAKEHSVAERLSGSDLQGIFRNVLGMSAEQFLHENLKWIFEKFNRDYYILVAADKFEHRCEVDVETIVKECFGYSVEDYVEVLITVFWLCSKHPEPLSAPESFYNRKDGTVLTQENITRFVDYYSCSYDDLRKLPLEKQLLYSKPFIKTKREESYVASSMFLVAMMVGNGLYWLVRDYHRKSQHFVNAFGHLFEDYIKELASTYCKTDKWGVLPTTGKKGADFIFDFSKLKMIVESKTSLLMLDAKQQVPNPRSIDKFYQNTIFEAAEQLNSSYDEIVKSSNVPIIKIILLYDEFSNTSIIEKACPEVFENESPCFIMTIREFEIMLSMCANDTRKKEVFLDMIISNVSGEEERMSIGSILERLDLCQNHHFDGERDYFSKMLKQFESDFES